MKELILNKEGLTNLPQTPYSKGGDIFMEGKPNMPANSQPTNPEHAEKAPQAPKLGVEKPVSAERQATARKAWKDLYAGENLPFEMRQTIEGAIQMGIHPASEGVQGKQVERLRFPNTSQSKEVQKRNQEEFIKLGSADAVIEAENAWIVFNQGKKLSLEEVWKQRYMRALGRKPGESLSHQEESTFGRWLVREIPNDPELSTIHERHTYELAKLVPEQEAVKRQGEEAHGIKTYLQNAIDATGIFDSGLRGTVDRFNRRLGRGLIEYAEVDQTAREIEARLGTTPLLPPNEQRWARQTVDQLEQNMAHIRRRQEVAQRERETMNERQYRLREIGTAKYTSEQLIGNREDRDEVFNDLFAGVDSVPHEFFQTAFNPLTRGMYYEAFMDLIREASVGKLEGFDNIINNIARNQNRPLEEIRQELQKELEDDYRRYQTERRMRQTLHDVNAALYIASISGEQLWEHMQQFGSDLGDVAFKTAGVRQMMDIYEQAIRESMVENDGYLKPEAILGKVERDAEGNPRIRISRGEIEVTTKARFEEKNRNHKIFVKDENGKPAPLGLLESWEVDRIFSIAQGMMITTERLISLAAESKLPKGSFSSLFGQDILQQYSSYIHLLGKYGIGEKDLAAYLYKRGESPGPLGFFRRWDASQLKEVLESFEKDPQKFLNEPNKERGDDLRYLMLRNPNRAGDIFTWLSWRAQERPDAVSMSQDFIIAGQKRMEDRLEARRRQGLGLPNGVASEQDYKNEYANWMGTALRLERMRTNLSRSQEEVSKLPKERQAEVVEQIGKAERIIEQMVRIQPHRLYLVSPEVRQRVDALLMEDIDFQNLKTRLINTEIANYPGKDAKTAEKNVIAKMLDNLSLVEGKLLQSREMLLDRGETFDTVSLDEFYSEISNYDERDLVEFFTRAVSDDFNDKTQNYYDEFASYEREYKHGFVLWSGDAPVDEFNVSALGPSGGFARRARDNKAQSEAIKEEIKLLTNLKNLKHPDEIIAQLAVIHEKIVAYDSGKAKQAIAEKAEGIAKLYAADFLTNIPVVGMVMKQIGKASFAQITYDDKSAAVWSAHDINYFFTRLKQKNLISKEQYNVLKRKTFAGIPDASIDVGITMAQFVALALALYLAEKLLKDKQQ